MNKKFMYSLMLLAITAHAQPGLRNAPAQVQLNGAPSANGDAGKAKLAEGMEYFYGLSRQYDPAKAFEDFQQSADQGNSTAMNFLANMYAGGLVVKQNMSTAIGWYEKAGNLGNTMAMNNLAGFYRDGDMVPQDFSRSASYYRKSAALGDPWARGTLAYFYYKGLGVKQDYGEAFALYKGLAGKDGNINDCYFLGLCYRNGYGTEVDMAEAKKWLQKADGKGDAMAIHELTAEPLPENRSVVSRDLQEKVAGLKSHTEKFIAQNSNDISGTYTGYAVYYDFSKKFVHDIVPLELDLQRAPGGYEGTWTEGDSLVAAVKGSYSNNGFFFDSSSQYTRSNYYSYRSQEKYRFNTAALDMKYFNDSVYLAGDVQFYSITRKEPGQPMYIMLQKKGQADNISPAAADMLLTLSPNPATAIVKAAFTIYKTEKVQLQIAAMDGRPVSQPSGETLPSGSYTYSLGVSTLAAGTYILKLTAGGRVQAKTFIKL